MKEDITLNKEDNSSMTYPQPRADIDVSQMSEAQFHAKLNKGYTDYIEGNTYVVEEVFEDFKKSNFK